MAFRAKSSMHLISSSWCLWAMAYSRSRSPRRCRVGACSCRNAAAPNAGVAARCSRTSQSWRQSRNAAVLQRPATPQRHSAPQREACFSRPPFFVHCIASALWGARMAQALELRRSGGLAPSAGWQDSRAMHDSRGQCGEKRPSLARSARGASPKGGLRRFSDTWRAYLAKASSF